MILFGEWGSMQMTVMNEGLPLNSNYIKFGLKKGGFQDPLSSVPNTATFRTIEIVCNEV